MTNDSENNVVDMTDRVARDQASNDDRLNALKRLLRDVETIDMAPQEVLVLCEREVADCTVEEVAQALRIVGAEHMREADALKSFQDERFGR